MYEDDPDEPKSTTAQFGIALKTRDSPIVRAPTDLRDELEIGRHVRSSFDYCAYQTVFRDNGSPKSGTQFPLVDDDKSFERMLKNSMPGITRKHRSWVESEQRIRRIQRRRCSRSPHLPHQQRWVENRRQQK